MKKIILPIILSLVVFTSSNVKALENNYINDNGVILTQEEYSIVSKLFYEGYQKFITKNDYNNIFNFDNNTKLTENIIEKKIINYDKNYMPLSSSHSSSSKSITISKACTSSCFITIVAEWKKSPNVRSYDLIGAYLKT